MGKTACAKAAQYLKGMCEAVLKAVAVIKSSEEETHLMSVDREDTCEAELNSTLKGAIEGLNAQRLANAFNDWPNLELRIDASAARGVIMRQGVGKVRHLHVKQMWIQEAVAAGELVVVKAPPAENCADALTRAWTSADLAF